MKQLYKNKDIAKNQPDIANLISKLEKDIFKHCEILIDKKSRKLHHELNRKMLNFSDKILRQSTDNLFNLRQHNFSSPRDHSGFSPSSNQFLSSITNEIKKNLFGSL